MKKAAGGVVRFLSHCPPVTAVRLVCAAVAGLLVIALAAVPKAWPPGAGAEAKIAQYVAGYLWVGLLFALGTVTALGLTVRWWMRPLGSPGASDPFSPFHPPRWFWPLVLVAMALNAALCWPRLGHSFWHDETYPIRNAIVGLYKKHADGSLKLRPVTWTETLFFYKKPNHTFYSALARACNDGWRAVARPRGLQFNERVIRLPAYLAGIASIASLAVLLGYLRFPSAGVLAAFLSALHPWHIRYASEARAYAFVLLLVPLVIYFLLRAVREGRWRWWIGFALAEFLLIFFYPTCVYVLLVANLFAVPALWWTWGRQSLVPFLRWLVANGVAAALFLPLILPCVPQFLAYVRGTPGQGQLSLVWIANFLAHMIAGIPWAYHGHYAPGTLELYPWYVAHPGLGVLIALLAVIFLVLGIRRLVVQDRVSALVPILFLAPAMLCYLETALRKGFIYEWYLIFLLPGAIALVALGLDDLLPRPDASPLGRAAAAAFVLAVIAGFAVWTTPQRNFLLSHSIQPGRESVLLTRPTLDPHDPRQKDILTATFYGAPDPYDPNIILFRNATELGELTRRADREGKALYINLGYLTTVEGEHSHKFDLLKNSGLFENLGELDGYEPTMQSRQVFRYLPGTAKDFDFAAVPADRGRPGLGYSY